MNTESVVQNPFMLMLSPELVLAAMERSEKLGRLNRRLCQPLDRQMPVPAAVDDVSDADDVRHEA